MVNSGAIIVSSLIQNKLNLADRFEYVSYFGKIPLYVHKIKILNAYRKISGGEYVGFNNAV